VVVVAHTVHTAQVRFWNRPKNMSGSHIRGTAHMNEMRRAEFSADHGH
jgi:hypothetical protein